MSPFDAVIVGETPSSSYSCPKVVITSVMTTDEIITHLSQSGCEDLTSQLSLTDFSRYPVSNGGFGEVYFGKLVTGYKVAVKVLRPCDSEGLQPGKYQKRAAKEIHTWSKCKHQNVARLIGIAIFRDRLAMISEWAANGTLPTFLKRNPSTNRCSLATSICEGLVYLHKVNIIHGDLKGANILISGQGTPMLTDFGSANFHESSLQFTATGTSNFSTRWTAPEILSEAGPVSRSGDVYALGMTIMEALTGEVPFSGIKNIHIYTTVVVHNKVPKRPEQHIPSQSVCGNILWAILTSCWSSDPHLRPTAVEVRDFIKPITPEKLKIVQR